MAKQAFQQWYWSDWFGDTNVARLDPASRCVWFELLGIMSQEGTFQVSDDVSSLARATRVRETVMEKALQKIEEKNVAQVIKNNGVYTVISRRLERETISRQQKTERQRRWRDGQRDAGVDADVDVLETSKKHDTRARYSETYKEKYIKENPDVERLIAAEAEEIVNLHPRRSDHRASVRAVIDAVWREADRGIPPEAALRMLRSRTVAYAEAVREWPPGERRYIKGALAWYQNGCYADDPATWRQGKEAETPFSGNHEVVL